MASSSNNGGTNAIKKLEYWTNQQQESSKATSAADKERNILQDRLQQLKARTAKIRQATSQAKDALGKHHEIFRQLEAKKKQLERELDKERAQLESCANATKQLNNEFSAFQKKAAISYKELNAELAQVLRDQEIDLVKSYISADTVGKLQGKSVAQCPEYDDMKVKFDEHGKLVTMRTALAEKVQALRSKALKTSSTDPSISKESLMDLERLWAKQNHPQDVENVDTNDTVHLQLFYGQSKGVES